MVHSPTEVSGAGSMKQLNPPYSARIDDAAFPPPEGFSMEHQPAMSTAVHGEQQPSSPSAAPPPAPAPRLAADSHDVIEVRGARENNLADISLDIPKRRLTVFTGVSGSGQVLAGLRHHRRRVAAPDQRDLHRVHPVVHAQSRAGPTSTSLRNLSAAIIVDQERMGANSRSTVGTATDAHTMLRIIFSRLGQPARRHLRRVQLQPAEGMCPECEGLGHVSDDRRRRAGRPSNCR